MLLEFLFGWRKASKCKELLRCVRYRLKLLRNKREVLVRQLREDVAQILNNAKHPTTAFSRVEQLFKDESMLAAYDLLDHFCEFIIINLPYIRRNRDCPNDINEAVSSLIFAAARCADLPELQVLRKLFGERYGKDFAVTAVELFPGNHVNRQISEKLSVKSISDDVKLMLLEEIYLDYNLQEQVDALTSRKSESGWEKEASERDIQVYSDIYQVRMHASNAKEISQMNNQKRTKHGESILEEACFYDSSSNWKKLIGNLSVSSGNSDIINHFQPNKQRENEGKDERWISIEVSDFGNHNYSNKCTDVREPYDGRSRLSPGPSRKRRKSSEQKSQKRSISGKGQLSTSCIENNDLRHIHNTSRTIISRNIHQRRHHSSTSISLEMKDLESTIYYNGASDCSDAEYPAIHWKSDRYKRTKPNGNQIRSECSHGNGRRLNIHDKKHSKISSEGSGRHSIRVPENMTSHRCKYNGRRSDTGGSVGADCCLDHPCYFLATDVDEVIEKSMSVKQTSNDIREGKSVQVSTIWDSNSATDPNRNTSTRTDSRYSAASHSQESEGNNDEEKPQKCVQPQKTPPYFRTVSMPIKMSKITLMNQTMRSASFGHVHPKLPDYDDLTATFTALKKDHCNRTTCVSTNG